METTLGRAAGMLTQLSRAAHGTGPLVGTRTDELRSARIVAETVRRTLEHDAGRAIDTLGYDGAVSIAAARSEVFSGRVLLRQAMEDTNLAANDGVRLANRLAGRAGTHFDAALDHVAAATTRLDT